LAKVQRTVVHIDEEKCDGCGACVPSCAEGAIQIIDGKARLVSDIYCDGLGACLGECPRGAIKLVERAAEAYDERAAAEHLKAGGRDAEPSPTPAAGETTLPCGCPGAHTMDFREEAKEGRPGRGDAEATRSPSELRHWPVKLYLAHPEAPYFEDAELLVAADCAPVAYGAFHPDFLRGKAVVIGCPKLDNAELYVKKLAAIFRAHNIQKVQVLHLEVPCCFGLARIVQQALAAAGKRVPVEDATVSVRGEVTAGAGA